MSNKLWFRHGFGPELIQRSATLPHVIDYRGMIPDERAPIEIARELARKIVDQSGPVTLMVSGGVDSQAMAYAFKTAGVPFRAVLARYNDDLNLHDYESSLPFYRCHNIPIDFIDLNVVDFHEMELNDWADRYHNNSPHILVHAKIASLLPDTIVSSGCLIRQYSDFTIGHVGYSTFGLHRYGEISGQNVIALFLSHDPRLVWACANLRVAKGEDQYRSKLECYHRGGFPVLPQVQKMHGFEKLKELYDGTNIPIRTRMKYKGRASKRPYDLLFRYPLEDRVHYLESSETWLNK